MKTSSTMSADLKSGQPEAYVEIIFPHSQEAPPQRNIAFTRIVYGQGALQGDVDRVHMLGDQAAVNGMIAGELTARLPSASTM